MKTYEFKNARHKLVFISKLRQADIPFKEGVTEVKILTDSLTLTVLIDSYYQLLIIQ